MRRAVVVLLLLSIMLGLQFFDPESTHSSHMTLAAIGFVVLAAFAVAELGQQVKLPKVTGYILAGAALGPYASEVLTAEVVEELGMFNTLAVGLIATTAGLELDAVAIRRVFRTLMATIGLKIVLAATAVGLFVAFAGQLGPLALVGAGVPAMGLIFAAVSIGTSPAVTLAVIEESRAKGRLSDLALAAAVFKDLVVVVALAVAIAASKSLIESEPLGGAVLGHVMLELGESIVAGVLLGGVLLAYMRWIGAEMLLFVAAVVLVVAEISHAFHLEFLLVFIAAGFVVGNFSDREHQLLVPLQRVSLPIFVIFFTNAGANVDLAAVWSLLPLALGVAGVRALGYFVASDLGGRLGGEDELIRRWAWGAYLPQAGVTLGLLGLASQSLPALADPIWNLGMAVVSINLLVGPVVARMALSKVGEAAGSAPRAASEEGDDDRPPAVLPISLRPHLGLTVDAIAEHIERWESTVFLPSLMAGVAELRAQLPDTGVTHPVRGASPELARRLADGLGSFDESVKISLRRLPHEIAVPMARDALRPAPSDSRWLSVSKRFRRVSGWVSARARDRVVPIRLAARFVVEPAVARLCLAELHEYARFRARAFDEVRRVVRNVTAPATARENLAELSRRFIDERERARTGELERVRQRLTTVLAHIDGPGHPRRAIRFSRIHRAVDADRAALLRDAAAWVDREAGLASTLTFLGGGESLLETLAATMRAEVVDTAEEADAALQKVLAAARRRLTVLRDELDAATPATVDYDTLAVRVAALIPKPAQRRLTAIHKRVAHADVRVKIGASARAMVSALDDEFSLVPPPGTIAEAPNPTAASLRRAPAQELAERIFLARLLPALDELVERTEDAVSSASRGWRAVIRDLGIQVELRDDTQSDDARLGAVRRAAARAEVGLVGASESAAEQLESVARVLDGMLDDARSELARSLGEVGAAARSVDSGAGVRDRVSASVRAAIARALSAWHHLRNLVGRETATGRLAHQYRLRSGQAAFDGRAMRVFLAERIALASLDLGPSLGGLLHIGPIKDPRLFTLREEQLGVLLSIERDWSRESRPGPTLVIGGPGSGKSSLLAVARLRVTSRRVVLVRATARARSLGLREALARAATVPVDRLQAALNQSRRVILVDDLDAWFPPTARGMAELEAFIDLLSSTRRQTLWVVAVDHSAALAIAETTSALAAFSNVVRLGPATSSELEALLRGRHAMAGIEFRVNTGLTAALPNIATRLSERAMFRALAHACSGGLREALLLWRRHLTVTDDGAELDAIGIADVGFPFLRRFDAMSVGILVALARHHGLDTASLATALGVRQAEISQRLESFKDIGLTTSDGVWDIAALFRDDVCAALVEIGALEEVA